MIYNCLTDCHNKVNKFLLMVEFEHPVIYTYCDICYFKYDRVKKGNKLITEIELKLYLIQGAEIQ